MFAYITRVNYFWLFLITFAVFSSDFPAQEILYRKKKNALKWVELVHISGFTQWDTEMQIRAHRLLNSIDFISFWKKSDLL